MSVFLEDEDGMVGGVLPFDFPLGGESLVQAGGQPGVPGAASGDHGEGEGDAPYRGPPFVVRVGFPDIDCHVSGAFCVDAGSVP